MAPPTAGLFLLGVSSEGPGEAGRLTAPEAPTVTLDTPVGASQPESQAVSGPKAKARVLESDLSPASSLGEGGKASAGLHHISRSSFFPPLEWFLQIISFSFPSCALSAFLPISVRS